MQGHDLVPRRLDDLRQLQRGRRLASTKLPYNELVYRMSAGRDGPASSSRTCVLVQIWDTPLAGSTREARGNSNIVTPEGFHPHVFSAATLELLDGER